jgi:hypothetical protein
MEIVNGFASWQTKPVTLNDDQRRPPTAPHRRSGRVSPHAPGPPQLGGRQEVHMHTDFTTNLLALSALGFVTAVVLGMV